MRLYATLGKIVSDIFQLLIIFYECKLSISFIAARKLQGGRYV